VYVNRTGQPLPAGLPAPITEVSDLQGFVTWLAGQPAKMRSN
jgi:hypothetical protein